MSHTAGCTSVTNFAAPGRRISSRSYSRQYQSSSVDSLDVGVTQDDGNNGGDNGNNGGGNDNNGNGDGADARDN